MSNVGIKIQARNENFINPTIPTRDDVRKLNYIRRQAQLNSEGFYSKLWKPYICIGHPLEFDKALEVINIENKEQVEQKNEIQENIEKPMQISSVSNRSTPIIQSYRKCSEKLEQLNKSLKEEIKKSELQSFTVRTGHSFFEILQKEQDDKKTIANEAVLLQKLKDTTEIRPAIEHSDSESESEYQPSDNKEYSSRPSTGVSKKKLSLRPFTPLYNNISNLSNRSNIRPHSEYGLSSKSITQMSFVSDDIEQERFTFFGIFYLIIFMFSLFRQLTSLYWLLKAMVRENVENMPRISLSWIIRKENNNLTSYKNKKDIKNNWDKYVSKSEHSNKTRTITNVPLTTQQNRISNIGQLSKSKENNIEIDDKDSKQLNKSMKLANSLLETKSNQYENSAYKPPQTAMVLKRKKMLAQVRSVCEDIEKDKNDYEYKKRLHSMRINRIPTEPNRIAESTKLLPEDNYSDKLQQNLSKHHDQSIQMIDEKLSGLTDNVRNMTEYKRIICSNKYKDIQTRGAFHQMLKHFRGKNTYQNFFTNLDKSKNKIIYTNWFLSLEESLKICYENKRIEKAVERIRKYALNTITKLNRNRLFSVLKYLSDWEIRHPDISASIKFITDNIVSVSEEEYQIWFEKNFN